jgi:excisionase family DNA binding protein
MTTTTEATVQLIKRRFANLKEAGQMIGYSADTLRRMVHDGTLKGHRLRGKILIDLDELHSLISQSC